MVDYFCILFKSVENNNKFLNKIKYYAVLRFLIRFSANIIIPIFFFFTSKRKVNRLNPDSHYADHTKLIVSLTTYPARINKIWIVIECMIRQKKQPDKILLWLSKDQFKSISILPRKLQRLQNRGLEIVLCDGDLKSHKKYYYSLQRYPNDILITVDDDFIYPLDLIKELIVKHHQYPQAICCNRALKITTLNNKILPYNQWKYLNVEAGPSFSVFQTSGGGTLYPPKTFPIEVLNEEVFMKFCSNADDVWLNIISQMNNIKVVKINSKNDLIPFIIMNNNNLTTLNVHEGQNDKQLEDVRNFYISKNQIDPMKNLMVELSK